MTLVRIAHRGLWKQGSHVLSPRIREGEKFKMTIESSGQEYTFEGYLTSTEINAESRDLDVDYYTQAPRLMPSYTVDLSIQVVGSGIERRLLPKKAPNVQ